MSRTSGPADPVIDATGPPTVAPQPRSRVGALIGWSTLALGSAASRGLSLVAAVIVARALGPAGFGDFSIFFAVVVVFSMATQFVDVTFVRYATSSLAPVAALRASVLVKLAIVGVFAVLSYPLAVLLARGVFDRPALTGPIVVAVLTGLAIGLVSLRASTYLAASRYTAYTLVGSAFYVVVVAALLAFWAFRSTLEPWTIYWLFLAAGLCVGAPALLTLVLEARPLRPDRAALDQIVRFAKWLFAANVVTVLIQRLDIFVLARYADQVEVGLYGAAIRISVVVSLMIGALSGFLLPRVGASTTSRSALREHLHEIRFFALVLVVLTVATWIVTPQLVDALFGPEFEGAVSLARIVLVGSLLMAISAPVGQLLLASEVPRGLFFLNVTRLACLLVLALLFAPRWGATGVAWASVATEAVALAYVGIAAIRIWRRTGDVAA